MVVGAAVVVVVVGRTVVVVATGAAVVVVTLAVVVVGAPVIEVVGAVDVVACTAAVEVVVATWPGERTGVGIFFSVALPMAPNPMRPTSTHVPIWAAFGQDRNFAHTAFGPVGLGGFAISTG